MHLHLLRRYSCHFDDSCLRARLGKIVPRLHRQQHISRQAESFLEADGHLGGEASTAVEQVAQSLTGDFQFLRKIGHAQSAGVEVDSIIGTTFGGRLATICHACFL